MNSFVALSSRTRHWGLALARFETTDNEKQSTKAQHSARSVGLLKIKNTLEKLAPSCWSQILNLLTMRLWKHAHEHNLSLGAVFCGECKGKVVHVHGVGAKTEDGKSRCDRASCSLSLACRPRAHSSAWGLTLRTILKQGPQGLPAKRPRSSLELARRR